MATNVPIVNPGQKFQTMLGQQQPHGVFHHQQAPMQPSHPVPGQPQGQIPMQPQHSQLAPAQQISGQPQTHQQATSQQQQQQHAQAAIDLDQKKLQDMTEAIVLINNIREDINSILDNVGKANSSNNYATILAGKQNTKSVSEINLEQIKPSHLTASVSQLQQNGSVGTPASVSNPYSQSQQVTNNQTETEQMSTNEVNDKFYNLEMEEQEFFEKTDNKYLQDKVLNINKSITELDKLITILQTVQVSNINSDYNALLLDQANDERSNYNSTKLIGSYRYILKLQEHINITNMPIYKRYQQTYSELKSPKYRAHFNKIKKEDLEKNASTVLANPEIRMVCAQRTEHQFVLDIIMPQNFKFVFMLFDWTVEKFQVRPLDSRILKIYSNNKPSDEICYFDFEHKNKTIVFQRLEENCLFAITFFKTEFTGISSLQQILKWIKNFKDLFNAKCSRCEKHLLNGVPPTWRDLKTYDPYHDECRIF